MMSREPRRWTAEEDQKLIRRVNEYMMRQTNPGHPISWSRISKDIVDRSNKDCRKRWAKLSAGRNRGVWEAAEDQRLIESVQIHGNRWTMAAERVRTRDADQCAKRWQHCLDPSLDRSEWTPEQDARLLKATERHGNNWKLIEEIEFPRRSTTCLKNRHIALTKQSSKSQHCPRTMSAQSLHSQRTGMGMVPATSTTDDRYGRDWFQYWGDAVSPASDFPSNSALATPSRYQSASSAPGLVNNRTSQSKASNSSMLSDWEQMFYNETFQTASSADPSSTFFLGQDDSTSSLESSPDHLIADFPEQLLAQTDHLSASCTDAVSFGSCRKNYVNGLSQVVGAKNSSTVPQITLTLDDPSPQTLANILAVLMTEKSKAIMMMVT